MEVNIRDLINRVRNFKHRIQEELSADDDFLLAIVIAVLEQVEELDKKETPMKPLVEMWELSSTDEKDILCPKCNTLLGTTEEHYESNYCFDCGQRLDWNIEEDSK